MRTLIIGIGSPLRQDDGLGAAAVDLLGRTLHDSPIEIVHYHQLVPELAEALAQCELAIFIDACVDGEPGALHSAPLMPAAADIHHSHHADPAVLLGSALRLYGRAPRAWLFTLTGADFGFGEALSPVVSAAIPHLIDAITACLHREGAL